MKPGTPKDQARVQIAMGQLGHRTGPKEDFEVKISISVTGMGGLEKFSQPH